MPLQASQPVHLSILLCRLDDQCRANRAHNDLRRTVVCQLDNLTEAFLCEQGVASCHLYIPVEKQDSSCIGFTTCPSLLSPSRSSVVCSAFQPCMTLIDEGLCMMVPNALQTKACMECFSKHGTALASCKQRTQQMIHHKRISDQVVPRMSHRCQETLLQCRGTMLRVQQQSQQQNICQAHSQRPCRSCMEEFTSSPGQMRVAWLQKGLEESLALMTEALSLTGYTAKQADHRLTYELTADFASSCHSQHCLPPLQEQ